jgi:phage terminase small subunit
MTREAAVKALVKANPGKLDSCVQYVDVWSEYREATANIQQNGLIVQHPRTMNPITNPYVAIRDSALKKMQLIRRLNVEVLWKQ